MGVAVGRVWLGGWKGLGGLEGWKAWKGWKGSGAKQAEGGWYGWSGWFGASVGYVSFCAEREWLAKLFLHMLMFAFKIDSRTICFLKACPMCAMPS